MIKLYNILCIIGILAIQPANAYTYSFANILDTPVMINFGGVAAGDMFSGSGKKDSQKKEYASNNYIVYEDAKNLKGPQIIPPKTTVEFRFTGTKSGICLKQDSFMLGIGNNQPIPVNIEAIPQGSSYTGNVMNNIQSIGNITQAATSALDEVIDLGDGFKAIKGLVPALIGLLKNSGCRSASFLVVKTQDNNYVLQSSSFS